MIPLILVPLSPHLVQGQTGSTFDLEEEKERQIDNDSRGRTSSTAATAEASVPVTATEKEQDLSAMGKILGSLNPESCKQRI